MAEQNISEIASVRAWAPVLRLVLRNVAQSEALSESASSIPPETLASVASQHKVTTRLANHPFAETILTAEQLRALRAAIEEEDRILGRLDAEAEVIGQHLSARCPSLDVIRLKGNNAAIHLGSKGYRRRSGDLDLLARAPLLLAQELKTLGYSALSDGICHEEPSMISPAAVPVDVHRYFPSWSYSRSSTGPGIDAQRVPFDVLADGAVADPAAASDCIRVPSATVCAFVICLHVFRDFIEPPYRKQVAKVRLGEVLEYREVKSSEGFSSSKFERLVIEFNASDAVSFVESLLAQLEETYPNSGRALKDDTPREIARGIMVSDDGDLDELLIRSALSESMRLDEGRSAVPPVLPANSRLLTSSVVAAPVILRNTTDPERALDFTVEWAFVGDEHIVVTLEVLARPGFYKDEVSVAFGDIHARVQRHSKSGLVTCAGPALVGAPSWEVKARSARVQLCLDLAILPTTPSGNRFEVSIAAHRFAHPLTDDWNDLYIHALSSTAMRIVLGGVP